MPSKSKKVQRANIADRRRQVALLLRSGYTNLQEIAARFGVHANTVVQDVKAIEAQWRAEQMEHMRAHRARLLVLNDDIRQKAIRAWERSLEDAQETHQSEEDIELAAGDGIQLPATKTRKGKRTKGQSGNPAYLRVLQDCNRFEAEVRGVLPNRDVVDETNPLEPTDRIDVTKLNPDELLIMGKILLQRQGIPWEAAVIDVDSEPVEDES